MFFLGRLGTIWTYLDCTWGIFFATTDLSCQSRGIPWLATLAVGTGRGGFFVAPAPCRPSSLIPTPIAVRLAIARRERESNGHLTRRRRRRNQPQANDDTTRSLIPTSAAVRLAIAHNERGLIGHRTRRHPRRHSHQPLPRTMSYPCSGSHTILPIYRRLYNGQRMPSVLELARAQTSPNEVQNVPDFPTENMSLAKGNILVRTPSKTEVGSVLSLSSSCHGRNRGCFLFYALRDLFAYYNNLVGVYVLRVGLSLESMFLSVLKSPC